MWSTFSTCKALLLGCNKIAAKWMCITCLAFQFSRKVFKLKEIHWMQSSWERVKDKGFHQRDEKLTSELQACSVYQFESIAQRLKNVVKCTCKVCWAKYFRFWSLQFEGKESLRNVALSFRIQPVCCDSPWIWPRSRPAPLVGPWGCHVPSI